MQQTSSVHVSNGGAHGATAPHSDDLPRGTETILLVESEEAALDYTAWILRELGYHVLTTRDGQEALCLFHQDPDRKVDLLVADATLPRVGGKTLAHLLGTYLPKWRVLINSFYPAELAIHNHLLDSELAYLQKPVTRHSIGFKVREVLDAARRKETEQLEKTGQLVFASAKDLESASVI